ncbi:hypothetical protein Rsub_00338 [Raphidocelis subcapitata]|uniref:Patatin n=1 Tax=Raphidocelis subcapitata TaxID=307507 RepID=A0A2V0NRR8_9CHLO|nr:hypothetical protein Rsub_00338 [Raphidocelis subcapitata]|eukprot:GBF87627.1 hypothetical protein Rsub_00338 [Raphidocelis subcapitata]
MLAQAATPLEAFQHGKLGLSFGGAGYLILWYAGVVKVFQELGIIESGRATPVAGASSGALTAATICSGTTADKFYSSVSSLTARCYKTPTDCAGNMDGAVRAALADYLPPDAAARCNNTGYMSVTVYDEPGHPRPAVVSTFSNSSDLISTLAASSYIPMWSGSRLFTSLRGRQAIDGSVSAPQPCPPSVEYCVRIASAPPEMSGPNAARGSAGVGEVIAQIQRAVNGQRTNAVNVRKPQLPDPSAARADPAKLEAFKKAGIDLAPGLAAENPFPADVWQELSTLPCDPATCDYIYKMGQVDAMAWAEATGIKAAAEARGKNRALLRLRRHAI